MSHALNYMVFWISWFHWTKFHSTCAWSNCSKWCGNILFSTFC